MIHAANTTLARAAKNLARLTDLLEVLQVASSRELTPGLKKARSILNSHFCLTAQIVDRLTGGDDFYSTTEALATANSTLDRVESSLNYPNGIDR